MNRNEKNKLILESIDQSGSIAVIPSKIGGVDTYCAGVGLYHVLAKVEKKVNFIYPGKIPEGYEDLIPSDAVLSNVRARDLVVAIDYSGTSVEKIQYNTEDNIFYLKLGPVPRDFDTNKVQTEVQGHKHDLYVIVGAQMPEDLGQTYHELERDLLVGKIINVDNTERNTRYGHYNIVDPLKDSLSLLMLHTALEWNFPINSEAAKAFLAGISHKK